MAANEDLWEGGLLLSISIRIQDFAADWSLTWPRILVSATLNLIGQGPHSSSSL